VALAPVVRLLFHTQQTLRLQRTQQPAQIARIQSQPVAQALDIRALRPHLEQQPRLAQGPSALEIAVLQHPDPPRDGAVETANLSDLPKSHYLTLVR
jgi:hypothetical protein